MTRRPAILLAALTGLASCSSVQTAYDQRAIDECRERPAIEEQRACENAARDAAQQRRQDKLD